MKDSEIKKIFYVTDDNGIFTVRIKSLECLPFVCPWSSYNILKARLFGLEYAEYLRMARDEYSAILIGQTGYIIEKFKEKNNANKICVELNKRINEVLEEIKNNEAKECI